MLIEPSPADTPYWARRRFNRALAGWCLVAIQLVVVIVLTVLLMI